MPRDIFGPQDKPFELVVIGIATRYDKTAKSYLGFAIVGDLRLWIRHFVNPKGFPMKRERISRS
jgi:hypothetical protein